MLPPEPPRWARWNPPPLGLRALPPKEPPPPNPPERRALPPKEPPPLNPPGRRVLPPKEPPPLNPPGRRALPPKAPPPWKPPPSSTPPRELPPPRPPFLWKPASADRHESLFSYLPAPVLAVDFPPKLRQPPCNPPGLPRAKRQAEKLHRRTEKICSPVRSCLAGFIRPLPPAACKILTSAVDNLLFQW